MAKISRIDYGKQISDRADEYFIVLDLPRVTYQQMDILQKVASTVLIEHLQKGDQVRVLKQLAISTDVKKEYEARNPSTNEKVVVPEHKIPKAHFTDSLKDAVRQSTNLDDKK